MISNGFQARLLNEDLGSIVETFALTPACSLFEGKGESVPSSPSAELPEPQSKAIFPTISVDCYNAALRPKALSVVRRGAVFVSPSSRSETSTAAPKDGQSMQANGRGQLNKLFLAFRWVGSEHSNAESANVLDDIGQAKLQPLQGIGLLQSNHRKLLENEKLIQADSASLANERKVSERKSRDFKNKLLTVTSHLLRIKSSTKGDGRRGTSLKCANDVTSRKVAKQPFLAQVYIDNRLIPMSALEVAISDSNREEQLSTVQLQGGALLDLGVVGSTTPDAAMNEILHTVTLHLWDSTRKDVEVPLTVEPGQQIQWGPKATVVPNVIFHFEIVSSGPLEVRTASPVPQILFQKASSKNSNGGLILENLTPATWTPDDAQLGRLESVAEEDSFRSIDEANLVGGSHSASRHTKMRKAASMAVSALKSRPQLETVQKKEEGKKKKEVEMQDAEPTADLSDEITTVGEVKAQDVDLVPNSKTSNTGATNPISSLVAQNPQQEEVCQTMRRVEGLKLEHLQVESEKKLLEDQWNQHLLKSLDEDICRLEKRVEAGKREIDILRKRVQHDST